MKIFLLTALIAVFSLSIFSQETATTESGKKVILKPDKTWEYLPERTKTVATSAATYTCAGEIATTTDRISGKTTTASKGTILISNDGKTGFGLILLKSSTGGIIFSIQAVQAGSGCIDDKAEILILFTDDSRMTLYNNGKFDCQGNAVVYFGGVFGNTDELSQLSTKKIQAMRVRTMKSSVERDFPDDKATQVMTQFDCLRKML